MAMPRRPPAETAEEPSPARWRWAVLPLLVVALYAPALRADFVNWDDPVHVYENPRVLEPDGLRRAWSDPSEPGPYPILYGMYFLEWRLAGGRPWLFHLDSVLLHAANALLVAGLAGALGLPPMAGMLVATLWAVHPMQVESVVWVSERKNVLYVFFWVLSLLLYLRSTADARVHLPSYLASLGCFALALLSKSAAVTLPAAIALADWARGHRLDRRFLLRLGPYAALALAGGFLLLAVVADLPKRPPFDARLGLAARAVWLYLGRLLWPADLVPVYPTWPLGRVGIAEAGSLLGVVVILAGLTMLWRRLPRSVVFGAGLFVTNIALVVGIVWNTYFRFAYVADRYVYLPSLGVILAAVVGLETLAANTRLARRASIGALTLAGVILAVLTRLQIPVWHDSETLWRFALAHNARCAPCLANLAVVLVDRDPETAAAHFEESIRIDRNPKTAMGLAAIRVDQGRLEEARALYEDALRGSPNNTKAHYNLANVLRQLGSAEEAIAHYRQALRLDPRSADAHHNLGVTLLQSGHTAEAQAEFEQALRLVPDDPETHYNLGLIASAMEDWPAAEQHYSIALRAGRADPGFASRHQGLAEALARQGKLAEAIEQYQAAHRLAPDDGDLLGELLEALVAAGRFGDAVALVEAAIAKAPDSPNALGSLAWLRATSPQAEWRDGAAAVRLAERARTLAGEPDADRLDTLAAAYAAAGRFPDAIRTATQALALADADSELAAEIRARLALYQAGQPYRTQ